ncbi:MAG: 4'-phosphopantetheinyl transferase superfamily protein [bacterium]
MLLVGNDIVDLNEAGIRGKSRHTRFVTRVFTEKERKMIHAAPNSDLALWILWAAKESAYKIVSKRFGPPVFSHQKFEASFEKEESWFEEDRSAVWVAYADTQYQFDFENHQKYVHAVGTFVTCGKRGDYILFSKTVRVTQNELACWQDKKVWQQMFSEKEQESVHRAESAYVRFLSKKALAEKLNVASNRLQIIRPERDGKSEPPHILLDNHRCEIDLSLSHHGRWIAWCFGMPQSLAPQ